MAARRPPPRPRSRETREQVARIVYEHERQERPFDPEEPPERYAAPHHFAVNPAAREYELGELAEEVDSVIADPEEHEDIIPFTRQQVGLKMMHWHAGQGDPVYAVGSTFYVGEVTDLNTMLSAQSHLEDPILARGLEFNADDQEELQVILRWLEFEIENAKMVNNPDEEGFEENPGDDLEENHGHVTSVEVTFVDGYKKTVSDSQTLGRLAKGHGGIKSAYLVEGEQYQREFWNTWREKWPRVERDIADWFNTLEHLTEDALEVVSKFASMVRHPGGPGSWRGR